MTVDYGIQEQPINSLGDSRRPGAPSVPPAGHHEYQQRLLSSLIRWTSYVFAFGIFISRLWFLLDFWNTLIRNGLVLLLLTGRWCIGQTNQGKAVRAGRVYLGSAMALASVVTLVLGERSIVNAVIALGPLVFIATFLEPERIAFRWGVLTSPYT